MNKFQSDRVTTFPVGNRKRRILRCLVAGTILVAASLVLRPRRRSPDAGRKEGVSRQPSAGDLALCVGLRGNGQYIWAHFTALANIVEDFGLIDGAAGGSSGTISMFLLESIQSNPLVQGETNKTEQRARVSFLLKSLLGLARFVDVDPVEVFAPVAAQIETKNISQRLQSDDEAVRLDATADLLDIFKDSTFVSLVNPDTVDLLLNSPDPQFHANDVVESIRSHFQATNPLAFVRPFPISFTGAMEIIDYPSSFLAGLDPVNLTEMKVLLDECAMASFGKEWPDVKDLQVRELNKTCEGFLLDMFETFVTDRDRAVHSTRLDARVGDNLQAMITSSVLTGDAIGVLEGALKAYANASVPVTWNISFEDVQFGFWGDGELLKRIKVTMPQRFNDSKSKRFLSLGEAKWIDVLVRSPAEPTLSRAVKIRGTAFASAGGWNDPVPAQVLSSMGCQRIILVTRREGMSEFGRNVSKLLGASDETLENIYGLGNSESGWNTALKNADGIWCTDEGSVPLSNITALSSKGWNAPLLTDNEDMQSSCRNYEGSKKLPGCTPLAKMV